MANKKTLVFFIARRLTINVETCYPVAILVCRSPPLIRLSFPILVHSLAIHLRTPDLCVIIFDIFWNGRIECACIGADVCVTNRKGKKSITYITPLTCLIQYEFIGFLLTLFEQPFPRAMIECVRCRARSFAKFSWSLLVFGKPQMLHCGRRFCLLHWD